MPEPIASPNRSMRRTLTLLALSWAILAVLALFQTAELRSQNRALAAANRAMDSMEQADAEMP